MMRRKMAAGSSPCWSTLIPVGKGLASACRFWGRNEGSGWEWQPAPRTPSRDSFHSRSTSVRHSGWTGDFAWTAEAKGNIYLDRWSLRSAEVWPGGGGGTCFRRSQLAPGPGSSGFRRLPWLHPAFFPEEQPNAHALGALAGVVLGALGGPMAGPCWVTAAPAHHPQSQRGPGAPPHTTCW